MCEGSSFVSQCEVRNDTTDRDVLPIPMITGVYYSRQGYHSLQHTGLYHSSQELAKLYRVSER